MTDISHLLNTRILNTLPRNSVLLISIFGYCAGVHSFAQTCSNLRNYVIMTADLGLPTAGGVVQSANHVRGPGGGYCRVLGQVRSIDPAADPIRFEVNLPQNWNGKALQFGGGAFNGFLRQSDGRGRTVLGDREQPTPLAQGYATFSSDSGHHKRYLLLPDVFNLANADFGVNDEERKNFASDSLQKTHDAAGKLMQARYKAAPRRMYFIGGSTGGREAMKVVDRWPADYDGVLAAYAAWNQTETDLQFFKVSQAMYAKGKNGQAGWVPPSKTKLLRDAVLQACDAGDGLKDGIVSNPASCFFDPATLRCKDGGDHKGCPSDGQERTVSAFSELQITTFSVENGMNQNPGYNVLRGADLVGNLGWVRHPFHPALPFLNSFYYLIGDGLVRSFLASDPRLPAANPKVNLFQINTSNGGAVGHSPKDYRTRIQEQSVEDDSSLSDLSAFAQHGGKLLLVHGVADYTIPTEASVLLYTRIVEAMGQQRVDDFVRLYLVPGMGHGQGVFFAGFDTLGVLDRWANESRPPVNLIATDQNKRGHRRQRPMCVWPSWPRFTAGDANAADSFVCALESACDKVRIGGRRPSY